MDKDLQCLKQAEPFLDQSRPLVCFDVGCNVNQILHGEHTDMTAMFLGAGFEIDHVYAFEPVHYQRFEERHGANDKVTLVKKALGDQSGEAEFFCPKAHGLSSLINRPVFSTWTDGLDKKTVEVTTIDEFMQANNIEHIDYIKLDVEGAELRVLKGATNALESGKITAGHFEYGVDDEYTKDDVVWFLNGFGYEVFFENDLNCVFRKNK